MNNVLILVINCGSSSLKYQLIDMDSETAMAKGLVNNIGIAGSGVKQESEKGKIRVEKSISDHGQAIQIMIDMLKDEEYGVIKDLGDIKAVGHRVLHGGAKFTQSMLVTPVVKQTIRACFPLGPLHNPANLIGIEACAKLMPDIPQVAVFDTAFHQTMPPKAYM